MTVEAHSVTDVNVENHYNYISYTEVYSTIESIGVQPYAMGKGL